MEWGNNETELYDGTSWTEVNNLNTARFELGSRGTYTAIAVGFGGTTLPGSNVTNTELWDGTSWTEVNDLNAARARMGYSSS